MVGGGGMVVVLASAESGVVCCFVLFVSCYRGAVTGRGIFLQF